MAEVGDNLLDVAKDADIDGVEGGFILFLFVLPSDFLNENNNINVLKGSCIQEITLNYEVH